MVSRSVFLCDNRFIETEAELLPNSLTAAYLKTRSTFVPEESHKPDECGTSCRMLQSPTETRFREAGRSLRSSEWDDEEENEEVHWTLKSRIMRIEENPFSNGWKTDFFHKHRSCFYFIFSGNYWDVIFSSWRSDPVWSSDPLIFLLSDLFKFFQFHSSKIMICFQQTMSCCLQKCVSTLLHLQTDWKPLCHEWRVFSCFNDVKNGKKLNVVCRSEFVILKQRKRFSEQKSL